MAGLESLNQEESISGSAVECSENPSIWEIQVPRTAAPRKWSWPVSERTVICAMDGRIREM